MRSLLFAAPLAVIAACGGSSHPAAPAPSAPVAWRDMDADQRHEFMEDVVMPKAKEVFMAFDAEAYKDMDCGTCHGPGADDRSFEMPNPDIKALPSSKEAYMAWIGQDAEAARMTKFMGEQVEPMMIELLQMTPFEPETGKGEFGCMNCHTLEGGAPATP
ncbi:MAG: hypothetical protein IPL61_35915 [Myxococcales bacterium]|nr:hypothetical protein [Myxococcales bacterium]